MTDSAPTERAERFSLVVGGPFHALLGRLGLTGPDQLPTTRAALGLAILVWLPPALVAVGQSLLDPTYRGLGYLSDWMAHSRYLIAVWAMIATERYADGRLLMLVRHFRIAGLLRDDSLATYRSAVALADHRSASHWAEAAILFLALAWSSLSSELSVDLSGVSWEGGEVGGEVVFSWAGQVARFWSTPLFLFLTLRWLWRFGVWTALLHRISRLPLQLSPLHPDRSAGLGFLAIYPTIFNGFVFALSCVVAAAMVKEIGLEHPAANMVWLALGLWLALCLALVVGPLLVFIRPLYAVRERALIDYGRLASQHHLAFHRRWIDEGRSGEELVGSADPSSVSDLNAAVEAVQRLRLVPVDRPAVLALVVSAGAPLLAVVMTQVPLRDLLKWLAGSIL
jgi:hypothetical protein